MCFQLIQYCIGILLYLLNGLCEIFDNGLFSRWRSPPVQKREGGSRQGKSHSYRPQKVSAPAHTLSQLKWHCGSAVQSSFSLNRKIVLAFYLFWPTISFTHCKYLHRTPLLLTWTAELCLRFIFYVFGYSANPKLFSNGPFRKTSPITFDILNVQYFDIHTCCELKAGLVETHYTVISTFTNI